MAVRGRDRDDAPPRQRPIDRGAPLRHADGGMVMSFEDITERLRAAEALEARVAERTADIAAVNDQLTAQVRERIAAEEAMREAMQAAEEANRSKTRFLAAASHDLLQPLNAARLFVSALGERRLAAANAGLVSRSIRRSIRSRTARGAARNLEARCRRGAAQRRRLPTRRNDAAHARGVHAASARARAGSRL